MKCAASVVVLQNACALCLACACRLPACFCIGDKAECGVLPPAVAVLPKQKFLRHRALIVS